MLAVKPDLVLPPIRHDLAAAKADLDAFGLVRFAGALTPAEVGAARARLVEQAAAERARGLAFRDGGADGKPGPNQRVWSLLTKGAIFRDLAVNPVATALIGHLLDADFLLSGFSANIAGKGGAPQTLHSDQQFFPASNAFTGVANCLFMLDAFTPENGATRVVPRSHLAGHWPTGTEPSTPVLGPPGTLMIWDGRLWHGTGSNTTDAARHGLLAFCCRPYLRQQETFTLSVSPELYAQCSPELRARMGFGMWVGNGIALGMVGGVVGQAVESLPVAMIPELHGAPAVGDA